MYAVTMLQGSWKEQLRRKFKNMRTPSANKRYRVNDEGNHGGHSGDPDDGNSGDQRTSTSSDPDSSQPRKRARLTTATTERSEDEETKYEQNVTDLCDEMKKEKPSKKVIKSLMIDTFGVRRNWIMVDHPSVQDVLEKFPPLKTAQHVSV